LIITSAESELSGQLIEELCLDFKGGGSLRLSSLSINLALRALSKAFNSDVGVLLEKVSDVNSLSTAEEQCKDEAGANKALSAKDSH